METQQQHHRHPGSGERELDKLRKTIEEYRIKAEASGGMTSSHERIMSSPLHHNHHHNHHDMSPFSPEASPRVRDYHNHHLAHQRRQSTVVTSSTASAADHRDKRVSSGSLSSMSSHASHSSVSSSSSATSIEGDHSKHGKKKRWQLPIKSAFSRSSKSSQSSGIHECDGELTMGGGDELVSPVSSHNADHDPQQNSAVNLVMASSGGSVDAKTYNEALMLIQEKDRKLTDVRLEALMTQHQLHQLHDQIEQMQHEMQLLRMENERLTSSHQDDNQSPSTIKSLFSSPPSQPSSTPNAFRISPLAADSPASCGTFLRRNSASGSSPAVAPSVAPGTSPHKHLHLDCSKIRRLVSSDHGANRIRFVVPNVGGGNGSSSSGSTLAYQQQHADCTVIGSLPVARNITWDELDKMTCDVFTDYCLCVDGESRLGLSSSSIAFYQVGDQTRMIGSSPPQLLPCAFIVGNVDSINISLKDGASAALDLLSFRTLIPKNVMQRYALNLLQRKQIILHGSSGTGKTFLAKSFARFLLNRQRRSLSFEEGVSVVDWKKSGAKALGAYVREMAGECERGGSGGKPSTSLPHVLIVDNCPSDGRALDDVFAPMFALNESVARPYIIGTSGDVKVEGDNETAAADKFYWISCLNKSAHVKDFLSRYLRRSVIEKEIVESRRGGGDDDGERENLLRVVTWLPLCWHHVNRNLDGIGLSDVRVGPHVFTPLPLDFSSSCHWFIKTWNTIIVPFVTAALKRSQPSSKSSESKWTDPTTWVTNSFPWNSSDMGCDYSLRLMKIPSTSAGPPTLTNPPIPPKSETVRQQVSSGVATAKKDIFSGAPGVISPPPIPPRPDTETTRRFSQHRRTMARRLSNGEVITEVEAAPTSSRGDIWHPRNR